VAYRYLRVRREGAVEHVTLDRPEVRNAFNDAVIAELTHWAHTTGEDRDVRAAVLAGAGPHFCAGADLEWMRRMGAAGEQDNLDDARRASAMLGALDALPVPLVGRFQGAALGGGTGLAAVCDIAVAADAAVFGFTEVRFGLLPAVIAPFAIAKIGVSAARELFLTGARFSAERAKAIGLVHAIVPAAELDATVARYIDELLAGAPSALATAKALIKAVAWRPAAEVSSLTSETIARQRLSPEGQEGLAAFLEKRSPSWKA
jgi:methylglutaconyl-CoA hydratase